MSNHLKHETSPYLLQHAENPVDWYPWGEEAFRRAKEEDKPIFLSIGYSTCHWCHVMAHESFEDREIAELLNRHFISIKVDKEERPDIDSIYMAVCQAFTGSGGWPTSIFMTPEQKPFFAGTYFPKAARGGMTGLYDLLTFIQETWETNRAALIGQAERVVAQLGQSGKAAPGKTGDLPDIAVGLYRHSYDSANGGFGSAPKFPTPHNLLFLLAYHQRRNSPDCLEMAETTLRRMYQGGLFDHIGGGFCRYSTDERFLVPHFEKMLYDNALLVMAYCQAFAVTQEPLYLDVAERTAGYVLREMTAPSGGFYSAQDADSDGEEGKYYLFTPDELLRLLGETDGNAFNSHFDITPAGNFEGKNIPNLLQSDPEDRSLRPLSETVYAYRKARCSLHLDDKILTSWNALMIAALCRLYLVSGTSAYLDAARRADRFIWEHLRDGGSLFVSFRAGRRGVKGFLDDYAAYLFAQLALYEATLEQGFLDRAEQLCQKALSSFGDSGGGFFLYGKDSETLILRPKETYDGAVPSGNSLMAWNLVRLSQLIPEGPYLEEAERQLRYMVSEASGYPAGYAMFLLALLDHQDPPAKVTIAAAPGADLTGLPPELPLGTAARLQNEPTAEYPLKDGKTTFYVCKGHACLPPSHHLEV